MEKIKEYKFDTVKSGEARNIEDFFEKLIKPQFENKEAIKQIHKSLMNYLNRKDATYFVRLYGSFLPDRYGELRRGFLTEYPDKTRMVFCDNTFSMLFAGFKIANISYSEKELDDLFKSRNLVCSFGLTTKEKELCYYLPSKALKVNLNSKGWYLAHIKPAGYGFTKENFSIRNFFENPDRKEWDLSTKTRKAKENLNENELKMLKAHFVRLIHPLNSFLVPKKNHVDYDGKNIGEENELLLYVQNYLKKEFPEEYNEFDAITLDYSFPIQNKDLKDIKWFESEIKKPKNKNMKPIKEKSSKQEQMTEKDDDTEERSLNLDRRLRSIGKETFIMLYPEIKNNPEITVDEIAKKYLHYSKYTFESQRGRLSSAKSIIKSGLAEEALNNIIDSKLVDEEIKNKAKQLLSSFEKD